MIIVTGISSIPQTYTIDQNTKPDLYCSPHTPCDVDVIPILTSLDPVLVCPLGLRMELVPEGNPQSDREKIGTQLILLGGKG